MERITGLAFLALVAIPLFAQDDEPPSVKKFNKTIAAQGATIMLLAHPTFAAGNINVDGYKKTDDIHQLMCTVVWNNASKTQFTTTFAFAFKVNDKNEIRDLRLSVVKDTCPTKAFKGSNLALGPFRIKVKNKVREYVDDDELLKSIDRISTAEGLLEVWLTYMDRSPKKK